MEEVLHLIVHPFLDSLKTLPFLLAAYLLIEYVEHRASNRFLNSLSKIGKAGPAVGAAVGLVPQCGFLISTIRLYSDGLITFGTVAAIFIATNDEALPVLFASPSHYKDALLLILIKFVLAAVVGFLFDAVIKKKKRIAPASHSHDSAHDHCEDGILRPAIIHTLKSWVFIFISLLVFDTVIHFVGEDAIASIFLDGSMLQPLIASLVGLIPGCAPSIILSQLYVSGAISFASLTAGLIVNSGVGLVFLFRSNKNVKNNILFTAFLFILAVIIGFILQLF